MKKVDGAGQSGEHELGGGKGCGRRQRDDAAKSGEHGRRIRDSG
jgi:hypothetical protein